MALIVRCISFHEAGGLGQRAAVFSGKVPQGDGPAVKTGGGDQRAGNELEFSHSQVRGCGGQQSGDGEAGRAPDFLVDVHDASNTEDKPCAIAAGINAADGEVEGSVKGDVTAFEVHLPEVQGGTGADRYIPRIAGAADGNVAVARNGDAAAVGGVHHGAVDVDGSGIVEDDIRALAVAAAGNAVAPVARVAQFIGVAFRRAGPTGPFRDHAGGIGANAQSAEQGGDR